MADDIMITVKQADGTMKQVPLSSLSKGGTNDENDKHTVPTNTNDTDETSESLESKESVPSESPKDEDIREKLNPQAASTIERAENKNQNTTVKPKSTETLPKDTPKPIDRLALLASLQQKGAVRAETKEESKKAEESKEVSASKKVRKNRKELQSATAVEEQKQELAPVDTSSKTMPSELKTSSNTDVVPVETSITPAVTTPNTHVFEHAIGESTPWRPTDTQPNSSHTTSEVSKAPPPPKVPVHIPEAVQLVLEANQVNLEDRLQKRLSQLIDSVQRAVRTPVQFLDAMTKDTIRGGMNFDATLAHSILDALGLDTEPDPAAVSSDRVQTDPPTPDRQIKPTEPKQRQQERVSPTMPPMSGTKKVPVTDVAPPALAVSNQGMTLSPGEELTSMTLDDFRRLGGRDVIGLDELKKKFEVLLQESVVNYLKAVDAWYKSPLFQSYLRVAVQSINSNTSVQAVLAQENAMTFEEWQAIETLQREIRL